MSKTNETQANQEETKLFADTNISEKTGTLVRDAALVSDGKFAKFTIANNKQYLTADNDIKTTTNYFNVLVSNNLKEAFNIAKTLKQGDWVHLIGNDSTELFKTSKGYKKNAAVIYAFEVSLRKKKAVHDQNSVQKNSSVEIT